MRKKAYFGSYMIPREGRKIFKNGSKKVKKMWGKSGAKLRKIFQNQNSILRFSTFHEIPVFFQRFFQKFNGCNSNSSFPRRNLWNNKRWKVKKVEYNVRRLTIWATFGFYPNEAMFVSAMQTKTVVATLPITDSSFSLRWLRGKVRGVDVQSSVLRDNVCNLMRWNVA